MNMKSTAMPVGELLNEYHLEKYGFNHFNRVGDYDVYYKLTPEQEKENLEMISYDEVWEIQRKGWDYFVIHFEKEKVYEGKISDTIFLEMLMQNIGVIE